MIDLIAIIACWIFAALHVLKIYSAYIRMERDGLAEAAVTQIWFSIASAILHAYAGYNLYALIS